MVMQIDFQWAGGATTSVQTKAGQVDICANTTINFQAGRSIKQTLCMYYQLHYKPISLSDFKVVTELFSLFYD